MYSLRAIRARRSKRRKEEVQKREVLVMKKVIENPGIATVNMGSCNRMSKSYLVIRKLDKAPFLFMSDYALYKIGDKAFTDERIELNKCGTENSIKMTIDTFDWYEFDTTLELFDYLTKHKKNKE
jgi:hypothetical protein